MENPIKVDDLGVSLVLETPYDVSFFEVTGLLVLGVSSWWNLTATSFPGTFEAKEKRHHRLFTKLRMLSHIGGKVHTQFFFPAPRTAIHFTKSLETHIEQWPVEWGDEILPSYIPGFFSIFGSWNLNQFRMTHGNHVISGWSHMKTILAARMSCWEKVPTLNRLVFV